jgi:hypothetical protein
MEKALIFIGIFVVGAAFLFKSWQNEREKQRKVEDESEKYHFSDQHIFEVLARFEADMLQYTDLPDAHSGRNAHIFRFLIKPWFETINAKLQYDAVAERKVKEDILEYMEAMDSRRSNLFNGMMANDKGNDEQERTYDAARMADELRLKVIEDSFAHAVGEDALRKLAEVRAINWFGAFSRDGQINPENYSQLPQDDGKKQFRVPKGF